MGGASSLILWKRQGRSWFGTSIIEWPGGNWSPIFPLLIAIGVGYVTWWLLGFTPPRAPK
jgi:hypothetical protein